MALREAFYEESAVSVRSKKEAKFYMTFHIVSVVFAVIAAIGIFLSFTEVANIVQSSEGFARAFALVQWFSFLAVLIGLFLIFFFLKKRFNVSFDYTFVQDELRVSKVFNGKKRKHLITFDAEHILKIGWVKNDSFDRTCSGMGKKDVVYFTPNREPAEGKEFYYLLYSGVMGKKVYVIEARQEILEYVVRAAGMNKLERR